MAERKVEIRVTVDDLEANRKLDALGAKLKGIGDKATIDLAVDDAKASAALDRIKARVDTLRAMSASLRVGVDDTEALLRLDQIQLRLDKLDKTTANPKIKVDGVTKAIGEVLTLGRLMDGLKNNGPVFDENQFRNVINESHRLEASSMAMRSSNLGRLDKNQSLRQDLARFLFEGSGGRLGGGGFNWGALIGRGAGWGSLFGGGGGAEGAAGAAESGGFSWGKLVMSPAGLGTIAALLGPVSSLIDVLGGMGVGTAGAAGAVGLAAKFNPAMLAPGMAHIDTTLSSVAQSIAPSIGMMLQDFAGKVQGLAPMLSKMFSAALPFIRQFLIMMEQAAKIILPAFTTVMKQMVSSGALKQFSDGLVILMKGIAEFLVALGPGMKAGAETFRAVAMGIAGLLDGLGHVFGQLGEATGIAYHAIHDWWDKLRHNTAVIFDGIRHDVAHYWDMIYTDVIGKVVQVYKDVNTWEQNMRHTIATIYDGIRHDVATAWDNIWTDTKNVVSNGVTTVVNFFKGLPGKILTALKNLGTSLYNLGKAALNDMWNGLKSVGGSIVSWAIGWVKNLPGALMHALGMSPPHPGSAFWDLGANIMHHLEAGIQSRANRARAAIHGALGGPSGGAPSAAANYARQLAARYGWGGEWGAINAVAMRESGWSMTARNPSSGAYGIAQFINGPSEYYQYGGNPNTIAGQVTAFFNYIRQRYGNPNAAWAHEMNYGWYDKGGVLKQGVTMALNTTGHDEYIVNPHTYGSGGGGAPVINVYVADGVNPDQAALKVIQSLRKYKIRHGNAVLGIA